MKKTIIAASLLTACITAGLIACSDGSQKQTGEVIISKDSLVNRGKYLVNAIGCDDCHSPKIMGPQGPEVDMEHRFAGHLSDMPIGKVLPAVMKDWMLFNHGLTAFAGPWGISYAANISSDATGIGNWTEDQFIRAIREGKSKGLAEARPLLPPMPWTVYRNLSDVDLKAIFAYLKTTKPIENRVPGPKAPNEL